MNLSIPCGLSTRFFTIVLCITGFGVAHAQLTLPKTLDDPGTSPSYTINWSDYSSVSVIQFGHFNLGDFTTDPISLGTHHSSTSTLRFSDSSTRTFSINHYRLTYTDDTQTTPEPIDIVADTIPITTNLQFQFTLDPFVAYQQEQYNPDEDQPLRPYFGRNLKIDFIAVGTTSPVPLYGTDGTPISFSAAELAVLGDSDGHSLQLVQLGTSPALSTTVAIAPNTDTQSIIDSLRVAAEPFAIYIEGREEDDGSLNIYADDAIEIQDGNTPTASKIINDPGVNPVTTFSWPENESALFVTNTSSRPTYRIYNLPLSDDDTHVIVGERSTYTAAHPLTYISDTQLTPVRLYDNDSVLLADNPSFTVSVDPFVMAQQDSPIVPYFGRAIRNGEEEFPRLEVRGLDTTIAVDSQGITGTAVSFTAEEITAITEADSTSLAVVQTATGLRSTLTVPTAADAQALADAIQEAANSLTVSIHAEHGTLSVVDPCEDPNQDENCNEELIIEHENDGTLNIYADEAIEIHYTTSSSTVHTDTLRKQGVLVYPNPVITQLHLVYPSATQATYTVYDLTGKAHSKHHASGQNHQLNVSGLSKGVYLLKAEHGNQQGVFRFVKE